MTGPFMIPALGEAITLATVLSSNRTNLTGNQRLRDLSFATTTVTYSIGILVFQDVFISFD